jgi:hypothetical protein
VPRPKKNGPGPVVSALEFRREKWWNRVIYLSRMMEWWSILQRQKNRFWEQALKLEFIEWMVVNNEAYLNTNSPLWIIYWITPTYHYDSLWTNSAIYVFYE